MSNNIYIYTNGADQQNMGLLDKNTQDLGFYAYVERLRNEICHLSHKAQHEVRDGSRRFGSIRVREREFDVQIIYVSPEDDQLNNIITLSKKELPKLIDVLSSF